MSTDICVRFGKRLRSLRKQREWTQVYMAEHVGMDRSFISDLENGRKEVCIRNLELLATAFGMTVSKLMSRLRRPSVVSADSEAVMVPAFPPNNRVCSRIGRYALRFGRAIRRIREAQRINQEEAAERCGLHRTYYSRVQRGIRNVSLVNIEKIAKGLRESLAELFSRL